MSFLFIGSTGDHAGHSLITWVLARRLLGKGLRVGFLKPFGTHPIQIEDHWTDRDAWLFKDILDLQEPFERICPCVVSEESWTHGPPDKLLKEIVTLAREMKKEKDVLLIMGSRRIFFDDAPFPLSEITLIPELAADVVLITRYQTVSKSMYSILSIASLLKDRVRGIILNRIPHEKLDRIQERIIPSLLQHGIPLTAALTEDTFLACRSIREILQILGGDLLCGEEKLEKPVGGLTVGSGDLKGELKIFKRAYNKIVLLEASPGHDATTGDAISRPVAGILLTGGRRPAPQLLQAAMNASIPLISVKGDTFASLERLEHTTPHLSPKDIDKVLHFTDLIDHDGALDNLIDSLNLS